MSFTDNLRRHVPCPPQSSTGDTVRAVLDDVFRDNAALKSYLLDDQGRLRKHVLIFVNTEKIADRTRLSDAVRPDDEIFVFQALSGG